MTVGSLRVLTVLMVVLGTTALGPVPAARACSCADWTEAEHAAVADVVLVGELLGRGTQDDEATVYDVGVAQVHVGRATAVQQVVTGGSGDTCALSLREGSRLLLFLREEQPYGPALEPGQLGADLCGGSRPLDVPAGPGTVGFPGVPAFLGPGRAPDEVRPALGAPPLDAVTTAGPVGGLSALLVGGLAIAAAAGAAGLLRARARGHRP